MLTRLIPKLRSALVGTLSLLATASLAQTTIHVGAGQPYTTIQSGIDAAHDGDTVLVAKGTYNENIDFKGKAITVISAEGAANTTIQGDGTTAVVLFRTDETRKTVLNGFTIQGAGSEQSSPFYGGGVYVESATPTILNNIIAGNPCHGIWVEFGGALIEGNTISATSAPANSYCNFNGSGILLIGNHTPASAVIGNTIINNQHAVQYDGGGIMLWAVENTVIESNVIANNGTTGQGGAIAAYNTDAMIIAQNLFYGNAAVYGAGAIAILAPSASQGPFIGLIQDNTFVGNTVSAPNQQGSLSASQVYLEGNLAQYEFTNNIVVGADSNPAFVCGTSYNYLSITPMVIDHNDIYNSVGPEYAGACPDQTGQYGNISADPLFKNAVGNDYHLLAGSPAIDTGNNSALQLLANLGYPLAGDFDGNPRAQDATGKGYPEIDMGAYEYSGSHTASPTTLVLNPSSYNMSGGQSFTLTGNLYSPLGTPTGTVTFFEDGNQIGSATIDSTGAALFTLGSGLVPGTHAFLATYPGESNFTPCESVKIYVLVNAFGVTLTLTSTPNPSLLGESVTFRTKITSANGVPPGIITLTDNSTSATLATLTPDANGNASYSISTLALGAHPIQASYPGNSNYLGASANVLQVVGSGFGTTTTLSSSLNPSPFGTAVSFTASVSSSGGGSPTGTIAFIEGGAPLATVNLQNGTAVYTTSSLSIGSHTIIANYEPAGTFGASTASLIEVIIGNTTSTALTCLPNPISIYSTAQLTATVASSNGTPTGAVSFTDNGTLLGTQNLISGATSFAYTGTTAQTHNIVATYAPTGAFAASSASCSEVVNLLPTASTLAVAPALSVYGSSITLTATVFPAALPAPSTPTGVVTFLNGASTIGTGTLAGGVATLGSVSLPAGNHSLTCIYGGSSIYATSNCNSSPIIILPAQTALTLSSSINPAPYLSAVTFATRLTVNGQSAGAGNAVHLSINGQIVSLTTDATGSAIYTVGTLPANSYPVTASFAATNNLLGSSASLTEVITAAPTAISLTGTPNPGDLNLPVTFTATVSTLTSSSPVGSGSVTFYDGASSLGSSQLSATGAASLTTSFSTLGVHNITAVNAGDANFSGSTSAVFKETINLGDFSISVLPGAGTVYTGEAPGAIKVSITSLLGFNQPLALTCVGLPANATCSFSPASIAGGQGTSILTIKTAAPHEVGAKAGMNAPANRLPISGKGRAVPAVFLAGLVLLVLPRRFRMRGWIAGLLAVCTLLGITACGAPTPITGGTPPGSYKVAVRAAYSGPVIQLEHSAQFTLTVKSLF